MPRPTPTKRDPESYDSGKNLGPVLASAVLLTLLAAAVALSMTLRARHPNPEVGPAPSFSVVPTAAPEIDVSE